MQKCNCGSKSVYFERHDGRHYCKECLARSVERTFRKELTGLKDKKVAVALSGGSDSSVLLHLMKKFFHGQLISISIDEGIKGYRDETLKYAKKLAKKLGVEHHIFSFKKEFGICDDEFPKNIKYCTYCAVLRRYLLNKKARELGAGVIALGHNLDDEAQSVLINFIKGDFSRFQRLGSRPALIEDEKFVPRIKPLRNLPKKKIAVYALTNDIEFLENKKCPYSGDNMRRDVQTALNALEEKYPGVKVQIVRFYDKLKPLMVENFEKRRNSAKLSYCRTCGEPSSKDVCKACELLKNLKNKTK